MRIFARNGPPVCDVRDRGGWTGAGIPAGVASEGFGRRVRDVVFDFFATARLP
jgi:hypothetical protein